MIKIHFPVEEQVLLRFLFPKLLCSVEKKLKEIVIKLAKQAKNVCFPVGYDLADHLLSVIIQSSWSI